MDIWQTRVSIARVGWDDYLDVDVFANADNSFSLGTAAQSVGRLDDFFNIFAADVDAFGFAPQSALQQFWNPGTLPNGTPGFYQVGTYAHQSAGASNFLHLSGSLAMQKLGNGNWVVATAEPISDGNYETVLAEFGSDLLQTSSAIQGSAFVPGPYDLSAHANNSYTLTYSHTYLPDPFQPRVYGDEIRASTSSSGAPSGNYLPLWNGQEGFLTSDSDSVSFDGSGASQVYWLEHSEFSSNAPNPLVRVHSVRTQALNAQGIPVGIIRTVHNGLIPDSASETGSLAATGSATHDFVVWAAESDVQSTVNQVMLMIRERGPTLGGPATSSFSISITDLLGLPAIGDGRRVHEVEVLNNGNIAVLWAVSNQNSAEDGVHVTIVTLQGTLVEDFVTTEFEDAAKVSMTELTDGRIALAGGITPAGEASAETTDDIGYMIIDPRADEMFGTEGADFITGKTNKAEIIHGGGGADRLYTMSGGGTLYGDAGEDLLYGGDGIDYFYGGTERDSIFGREGTDYIDGGAGDDNLNGDAGNDVFFSSAGADQFKGGADFDAVSYANSLNPIYFVNGSTSASVGDAVGDTFDSIESYFLSNHNDYFDASGLNQFLTIEGGNGQDTIFGSLQGGYLYGGNDKDLFVLTGGVTVVRGDEENGAQSTDILVLFNSTSGLNINMSSANTRNSAFTFTFNGQVQGAFGDVDGISGSFLQDFITGNLFDNYLDGSVGNDRLNGAEGDDTFVGGDGQDVLDGGIGSDTADYSDMTGAVTVVLNVANVAEVRVNGLNEDSIRNIENIIGGTGRDVLVGDLLSNRLTGGDNDDTLDGRGGIDTLVGGAGNDLMIVQDLGDRIIESVGGGIDRVVADVTYVLNSKAEVETLTTRQHSAVVDINLTGNEFGQIIQGSFGKNTLDGRGGADRLEGFAGDDLYIVDNLGDIVVEAIGGGNDRVVADVSYALNMGSEIEVLSTRTHKSSANPINLTGNEFNQTIYGDLGNNTLDGRAGADTLVGFGGDDTYIVDNTGDIISEASSGGTDRVVADISYTLNAGAVVETLTTRQHSLTNAINLTGNEFGQTIQGNFGANTLDGRGGADTLIGFAGNDLYIVDNLGDIVVEAASGGTDEVVADVSYVLNGGSEVELLRSRQQSLVAPLNLSGNEFGQTLRGTFGVNVLNGKGGNDILQGYNGADTFVFDTLLSASNIDQLPDFNVVDDTIHLDDAVFVGLATGALASTAFVLGAAATLANTAQIIYNAGTGAISYDRDGTNNTFAAQQFATVATGLGLTNADFYVI